MKNYKNNNIFDIIKNDNLEKITGKIKSLPGKQKEIIDKWRNNIENKKKL